MQEVRQGDSIRAFYNDPGQLRDICSFEEIGNFFFHAKLFKCKQL